MERHELNIVIGGEAGQGLVTVGRLLSLLLVKCGYEIVVTQSYQSRIRGGHNTFAVRVSTEPIESPTERVDILVALNMETIDIHSVDITEGGLIIADSALGSGNDSFFGVPFGELAPEMYMNTVALGVVSSVLGLDGRVAEALISEGIGKKHPESLEPNLDALRKGYEWSREHAPEGYRLAGSSGSGERLMLNGNEAIALGAASAGLRFCAFYPMTPATSIPLTLLRFDDRLGIVVEQAEDEIAAINMALGASYAGAPGMVATSGGGFALMVEGVSLAAMIETPIVLVIAQRPGPATGLPTRTEQADLKFVVSAGHGEFPRVVFAPSTIMECFELTRKAFFTAEKYQVPAFVLTDQYLADSYRAVERIDTEGLEEAVIGAADREVKTPYRRFALTDDGISPRLLPGAGKHLVVVDSDEHTEDGHLTEDLSVRKSMVEKRMKKEDGIAGEVIPPTLYGEAGADILLVSWGSSGGIVREVAGRLTGEGRSATVLHFSQVWPLVPDTFIDILKGSASVVSVEGNATGQLADLIRMTSGFDISSKILRYDGLPLTPEYVIGELENVGIV